MMERLGQQFGNYRLTRLLGEGGFAEVYLGEHIHVSSLVAIKVLRARFMTRERDRFFSEARTIALLDHPAIIRLLDFGMEGNDPFLVMDYAPNGTLRQRYPKGTKVPLGELLPFVQQIAAALQYAHDRKLVHRDVKPENILLRHENQAVLSDFGIALISSSSTSQSTNATAGTIAYMAPEQLLGKPVAASDQYALGIVVYEWLCGELPFSGSFPEVCAQHVYAAPPTFLSQGVPISRGVGAVVMKALAKDPKERFPSIQAFASALAQAASHAEEPCSASRLTMQRSTTYQTVNTPSEDSFAPRSAGDPSTSVRRARDEKATAGKAAQHTSLSVKERQDEAIGRRCSKGARLMIPLLLVVGLLLIVACVSPLSAPIWVHGNTSQMSSHGVNKAETGHRATHDPSTWDRGSPREAQRGFHHHHHHHHKSGAKQQPGVWHRNVTLRVG